jgi:hypothetical protein
LMLTNVPIPGVEVPVPTGVVGLDTVPVPAGVVLRPTLAAGAAAVVAGATAGAPTWGTEVPLQAPPANAGPAEPIAAIENPATDITAAASTAAVARLIVVDISKSPCWLAT